MEGRTRSGEMDAPEARREHEGSEMSRGYGMVWEGCVGTWVAGRQQEKGGMGIDCRGCLSRGRWRNLASGQPN